jgi:hypothetical protein
VAAALPLLVVEDLHWADDGSLDLLQHLLAHAAELPLALVMTGRPALLLRRPDWGPPGTLLTLAPLAAAHSDALLQALLQGLHSVPAPLSELIIGQAEGNPYYMEELVRRLVDDGVIEVGAPHWRVHLERLQNVRLPGTLVGLLQARLDALPAEQRRAARQASVIGHVFWDDALLALDPNAPQALPALQRAAFVRLHQSSDFEGTAERQFDHHLLHQVTYDTLLKTERRLGHSAAARWLSERTQGRGAEFLAMTAEHAERAGDTALAISCFEQAGLQARARFANAAAQSCFTRRPWPCWAIPSRCAASTCWTSWAKIADTVGDRASQESAHVEMAALLERHPDDARQAELLFSRALLADRRSDATASEPLALQSFELAERCGAAQWAAMAQGQLAWLHVARQDYAGATRHIEIGLPWAGRIEADTACRDRGPVADFVGHGCDAAVPPGRGAPHADGGAVARRGAGQAAPAAGGAGQPRGGIATPWGSGTIRPPGANAYSRWLTPLAPRKTSPVPGCAWLKPPKRGVTRRRRCAGTNAAWSSTAPQPTGAWRRSPSGFWPA